NPTSKYASENPCASQAARLVWGGRVYTPLPKQKSDSQEAPDEHNPSYAAANCHSSSFAPSWFCLRHCASCWRARQSFQPQKFSARFCHYDGEHRLRYPDRQLECSFHYRSSLQLQFGNQLLWRDPSQSAELHCRDLWLNEWRR